MTCKPKHRPPDSWPLVVQPERSSLRQADTSVIYTNMVRMARILACLMLLVSESPPCLLVCIDVAMTLILVLCCLAVRNILRLMKERKMHVTPIIMAISHLPSDDDNANKVHISSRRLAYTR